MMRIFLERCIPSNEAFVVFRHDFALVLDWEDLASLGRIESCFYLSVLYEIFDE